LPVPHFSKSTVSSHAFFLIHRSLHPCVIGIWKAEKPDLSPSLHGCERELMMTDPSHEGETGWHVDRGCGTGPAS
jgi:hypothetical protein